MTVEVRDQYYNMREKVEPVMYIIDIAKKAIEASGVECRVKAIRGEQTGRSFHSKDCRALTSLPGTEFSRAP